MLNLTSPSQSSSTVGAGYVPLTRVTRGGFTESIHYGAVAVTNAAGQLLYSAGDAQQFTFARSALKPFQAAPLLEARGVERLGLTKPETAVLCASHNGEARHAQAVASILDKAGAKPEQLRCGCHMPFRFAWFDKQPAPDEHWSQLHHNCSGKHAGMIAAARLGDASLEHYMDPAHPVQIAARQALADCTQMPAQDLVAATDGCSAPTYALPLAKLAQGYARLASPGAADSAQPYAQALSIAFDAMTAHPEMVSGEGRNDLAYTQAGGGDWVCKIGAEGVQAIGIRSLGLGIAIKVADGNMRGLHPATIAVLEQIGAMNEARRAQLADWAKPPIRSAAGAVVGTLEAVVSLQRA
jgi:L-asparaginase II